MIYYLKADYEIDDLYIAAENEKICGLYIGEEEFMEENSLKPMVHNEKISILQEAKKQLDEYFLKKRKEFSLPIQFNGTKFQCTVWNSLLTIPYGETRTYQEIAGMVGNVAAVRAVGQANRKNQIPIIIPCHRVIGKNGKLVGYLGSKIYFKEYLLKLEGAI